MAVTLIDCDGITIDGMEVPSFRLNTKEIICLHMPCLSSEIGAFVEVIAGRQPVHGLTIAGTVVWAERARFPSGFLGLFYQPRAEDWLRRAARISHQEAQAGVTRIGLPLGQKLCQLGGNWRLLLALEAARVSKAEVIVYTAAGCDPTGYHLAYQSSIANLHCCSTIQLCFRDIHGQFGQEDCHPKGKCLEIAQRARVRDEVTH